jgi:hypothetical protein
LSNPTCPFVETKLPFCRTYIQKESINTTTTTRAGAPEAEPSFDKRADSPPQGRRRISNDLVPHVGEVAALTEPTPAPEQVVASSLRWPTKLAAEWRSAIERTLLAAPEALRQALLDELEGQLGIAGKTIANPPGYVHGLIRRHAAGNLILAMADQVATARAERERHLAARERALKAAPQGGHQAQAEVQPSISEAAQAERNKLRALRKQLLGGGGK